jgi:hypothetical protein
VVCNLSLYGSVIGSLQFALNKSEDKSVHVLASNNIFVELISLTSHVLVKETHLDHLLLLSRCGNWRRTSCFCFYL